MLDAYFLECKFEEIRANCAFDSAYADLVLESESIHNLITDGVIQESSDESDYLYEEAGKSFIDAIKQFFAKLRDAMKDLVANIRFMFETMLAKREVNKKLTEVKKALAANHELVNKLNGNKYVYRDTAKYLDVYKKYINWYTTETKKLFNKQYKTVDKYNTALDKFRDEIDKKLIELNLSRGDAFVLESNFTKFYDATEKECENIAKIVNMVYDEFDAAMKEYEEISCNEDDPAKVSDIKKVASKINSIMSNALHIVTHGVMSNLQKILTVAGAIGGFAVAYGQCGDNLDMMGGTAVGVAAGAIAGKIGQDVYTKKLNKKMDEEKKAKLQKEAEDKARKAKAKIELNQKIDKLNRTGIINARHVD